MHPIFEQIEHTLSAALSGLDAAQTQLRPTAKPDNAPPEKWTIQQIVEHLQLTYTLTQRAFEARLAKARPTEATPTLQQRLAHFTIITLGIFPKGRAAPAPVMPITTAEPISAEQLTITTHQLLATLDPLYAQAEDLFGPTRAISHMILGPLSVPQWRRFHLIHARHHAKQIQAIRCNHGL